MNKQVLLFGAVLLLVILLSVEGGQVLKTSYDNLIAKYSYPPPRDLSSLEFQNMIKAVIIHESNWNPSIVGITGDIGLMQINPSNAPAYGLTTQDLYDPETNIRVGSDILRWSINNFGIRDGLAAYNGGPAKRNIAVTQAYADKVLSIYQNIVT